MKLSLANENNQKSFGFEKTFFADKNESEPAKTDLMNKTVELDYYLRNGSAPLPSKNYFKDNLGAQLKTLSNEILDANFKTLISKERELLAIVITYTAEVERRRMYLTMGYHSLFDFMTKHYGYSNGPAQRRIDAARLSLEVPGIVLNIEAGELNLSQVEVLQRGLREVGHKVSKEQKTELIESLKNKSVPDTQRAVSKALDITIKQTPKVTYQKDESVRFEVTLSKAQWEKMKRLRELLSNTLPSGAWDQILEYIADEKIEVLTKPRPKNKQLSLKQAVLSRDQCCQYKDQTSGKLCGSAWSLEVDHIQPRWAGGQDSIENMRVLCGNHNRHVYRQQANIRRV